MLWITRAELAAAVSNAGGLGTIGLNSGATAPTRDPDVLGERLRGQIQQVRNLTDKPFAVNVLVPARGDDVYSNKFVEVMIQERVPAAAVAGDNPTLYAERLKKAGIKVLHRPINPTVKAAREAEEAGADAVVIIGFDGDGHLGLEMLSTFVLVPQVADARGMVDKVDGELVVRLRGEGKSWREIAEAHPSVKSGKRKVRPSVGSLRRAFALLGSQ